MAKMERVKEDDPLRCQAVTNMGQCPYKRIEHSEYCIMHGGIKAQERHKKHQYHDYRIQQWQERVDELAGSQHVKNLRGEIGLLRMSLEHVLNLAKTPQQLLIYSDKIQSIIRDVKSLVETCQKIEERNKELLSKTEIMNIADAVINIMSSFITDPDDLLAAGEQLDAIITGIICGTSPTGNQSQIGH